MGGEQQSVKVAVEKIADKRRDKRVLVILLVVTVGLPIMFYLKNLDWQRINLRVDLTSWWREIGGSETVTFEK